MFISFYPLYSLQFLNSFHDAEAALVCEEGGGAFGVSLFFSALCTSAVNHKHLLALLVTEAVCAAAGIRLMLGSRHFTAKETKIKELFWFLEPFRYQ